MSAQKIDAVRAAALLSRLNGWKKNGETIFIEYRMQDFSSAVELVDRIAVLAEGMDHHPDIHLTGYRNLRLELSTHAIGGLSENDFALAAKIDGLPKKLKS